MSATSKSSGYSADVRAQLLVGGRVLDVAQLGPGYLILRDAFDSPPTDAVLTFQIDGKEKVRHLCLADGIKTDERKTRIAAVQSNQAADD